eukprot:scaffold37299_cov57-Phaeocystis_antarctica.AAC.2
MACEWHVHGMCIVVCACASGAPGVPEACWPSEPPPRHSSLTAGAAVEVRLLELVLFLNVAVLVHDLTALRVALAVVDVALAAVVEGVLPVGRVLAVGRALAGLLLDAAAARAAVVVREAELALGDPLVQHVAARAVAVLDVVLAPVPELVHPACVVPAVGRVAWLGVRVRARVGARVRARARARVKARAGTGARARSEARARPGAGTGAGAGVGGGLQLVAPLVEGGLPAVEAGAAVQHRDAVVPLNFQRGHGVVLHGLDELPVVVLALREGRRLAAGRVEVVVRIHGDLARPSGAEEQQEGARRAHFCEPVSLPGLEGRSI